MNKKALGMEVFNLLIAIAVIASAFFIFYTWYGFEGNTHTAKINAKSSDIQQDFTLINLLNTKVQDRTIADLTVIKDPKLKSGVDQTMQKIHGSAIRYTLVYDGNIIAETANPPNIVTEQRAVLPTPFGKPKNVILRFGI